MNTQPKTNIATIRGAFLATSALSLCCAAPTHAQAQAASQAATDDGAAVASEIVVTARGRTERLLQTPVAATAVSGAQLTTQGINQTSELAALVPALTIDASGAGSGGTIALRGISTSASQAGFDQAVSIAVDGVQIGRAQVLHMGLFDLDQIEVLKGPQALFFGKNSPGGVISLRTAGPTAQLEGYVRGGYEFVGDEYKIESAISGPITESLGARLAVSYRNLDGYLRNNRKTPLTAAENPIFGPLDGGPSPAGHQRPGDKELIGRLTLAYAPAGGDFDATLKLSGGRFRSDGPNPSQVVNCGGAATPILVFGPTTVPDPNGDCKADFRYTASGFSDTKISRWPLAKNLPYAKIDSYLAALSMNYHLRDDLTLASTTGYFSLNSKNFDNYDATVYAQIGAAEQERYRSFSQELRMISDFEGPLNFILGGFYQHTNLFFFDASQIAPGADNGSVSGAANAGKYHSWERPGRTRGNTYSAFGQLRWDIVDTLELAGGVRYTREVKNSTIGHTYVNSSVAALLLPVGTNYSSKFEGSNWSPEATLTYKPTRDLTFYGGYRTGYKSGGFGLTTVLTRNTTAASLTYEPEKIKGFEIGAKGHVIDRLLTFNLSAYTYRYSDLQVSQFDGATLSFRVTNAGAARVKGVEVELESKPAEGLTLNANANYNSAKYLRFSTLCYNTQTVAQGCVGGSQNLAGERLNQAPLWTGGAGFDYVTPVANDWKFGVAGNVRLTSKYHTQASNDPRSDQGAYQTFDGSIRLTSPGERYNIALIGRNLSNEKYFNVTQSKPGSGTVFDQIMAVVQRGRQVELELTVRY